MVLRKRKDCMIDWVFKRFIKPKRILQIGILPLISLIFVPPLNGQAVTDVWEDDFEDKDLKGWEVATYYTIDPINVGYSKGEVQIRNDNKRLLLSQPKNYTHAGMNIAERNSTQVYGHWSFDVDTTGGSTGVFGFIHRDPTPETDFEGWTLQDPNGIEGYFLGIYTQETEHQLMLGRMDVNFTNEGQNKTPPEDFLLDSINFDDMCFSPYGVFHIDITRTPSGNITVYINSTKAMSAIDNV
ncbi:MAG: hypothetical protein ACFFDT_38410, partial [Candidatus Hodarchaeota archaeon]